MRDLITLPKFSLLLPAFLRVRVMVGLGVYVFVISHRIEFYISTERTVFDLGVADYYSVNYDLTFYHVPSYLVDIFNRKQEIPQPKPVSLKYCLSFQGGTIDVSVCLDFFGVPAQRGIMADRKYAISDRF